MKFELSNYERQVLLYDVLHKLSYRVEFMMEDLPNLDVMDFFDKYYKKILHLASNFKYDSPKFIPGSNVDDEEFPD